MDSRAHSGDPGDPARTPGAPAQIAFIVDNTRGATDVLDHSSRVAILTCVMLEMGDACPGAVVDIPAQGAQPPEVDIDLDLVARENPGVLCHIYNIVAARRALMDTPAS